MRTTEGQAADDLQTTTAAPDTKMLTTERKPGVDDPATGSCNLPSCEDEATTSGLCDQHWSTHRGLADPEDQAPEQDAEVAAP